MTLEPSHQKVQATHLSRNAYLYVRQSSLRQVFENTESTHRQYALRERAVALGWPRERIVVIDCDQGQSGASAEGRKGFQQLVTDVGMGRAGIVMGLEVSRLARSSSDWHRLLEICALAETLILDEDGVYDPAHFNDRLLLGLKGTMSEAELHVLRARLIGGILSKAARGELRSPLPVGFVYDAEGRVALEPDRQVREALQSFFETFRRVGSASGLVKAFREQGVVFPRRIRSGAHKGEIGWTALTHSRALYVLHHPRYAGAFVWGRSRQRKNVAGKGCFRKLPREEWTSLIPDAHPGYIPWSEFEENQRRLRENSATQAAASQDRRRSPPREGPALLQGLVLCGRCGRRMTVRYSTQAGSRVPEYVCQRQGIQHAEPICQRIPGRSIDERISQLLVEAVTPLALEVALTVQQELHERLEEADRLRRMQVERARYEAELARRRYLQVDPDHRLVADELEAAWNEKLRALDAAQETYERQRQSDQAGLGEKEREQILALSSDFPRLWKNPRTPHRERKRMVRLLIDDVTLLRGDELTVHVRFRGGATRSLTLPRPKSAWELRQTNPEVVMKIDHLLDHHLEGEIAMLLNEKGYRSGEGKPFHGLMIHRLRQAYGLRTHFERLREQGLLTLGEMARKLEVSTITVKQWRLAGLLPAHPFDARGQCLYEPPGPHAPIRARWKGIAAARRLRKSHPDVTNEVQYEA